VKLLSPRFAPHLLALYALAAVPVFLHTFAEPARDDCAQPSALPRWQSGEGERGSLLRDRFEAFQWSEGDFEAEGVLFSFVFLRSYAVVQLLNRPENALLQRAPESRTVEWVDTQSGPVPIHRAIYEQRSDVATRTLAGYLLLLDGKPVARPALAQLGSAPSELLFGRMPMTLLFIHGRVPRDVYPEAETELRVRLVAALAQYRDACEAQSSPGSARAN
jgi:hypothetical protein